MKRTVFFILSGTLLFGLLYLTTHAQEDMETIDNSVFSKPVRPAVVFRHDEHNEKAELYECNECHHVYDEDGVLDEYESSEDQMCSDCHTSDRSDNKLTLMKAFHTNCKGCHEEKKNGPVMCGECHVRS